MAEDRKPQTSTTDEEIDEIKRRMAEGEETHPRKPEDRPHPPQSQFEESPRTEDADGAPDLGEPGAVEGGGASGGDLARGIGARDELKRSSERPAGKTRPTGADKQED